MCSVRLFSAPGVVERHKGLYGRREAALWVLPNSSLGVAMVSLRGSKGADMVVPNEHGL